MTKYRTKKHPAIFSTVVVAIALPFLSLNAATSRLYAETDETVSPLTTVNANETEVFCQVGDSLRLTGDVSMDRNYDTCEIFVDGAPAIRRTPTMGTDHYSFTWKPTVAATHVLQWVYTMQSGGKFRARRLLVVATDAAPYSVVALPASAAVDTPVTVQASSSSASPLARTDFYFNGAFLATRTVAPFTATLPVGAVTVPGKCSFRFTAYDSAGHAYTSHTFRVDVPQRIQFSPAKTVTLKTASDKVPLSVSLLPGVQVSKVSYLLVPEASGDWQPLSEGTAAPFAADGDLSRFSSGAYRLKVQATTEAGAVYETDPISINLINGPDDQQKARMAKAQADLDTKSARKNAQLQAAQAVVDHAQAEKEANLKLFLPRPGFDEQIFRKQLAALAYYEAPPRRTGLIGTVTGLAVRQSVNEDGDILSQSGTTQTITALVRPGTGQLNFLANSEEDAKISAQQAAEYCKLETAAHHWDWTRYDISVGFSDNSARLGGPSAGLADTVAIMSAALNVPVDTSVAMTGTITLRGQVQPVGGVDFKAEAAFSDANVHTLIVPSDADTGVTLFALFTTEPELCFNRRVVMVTAADQAFAQCFVGWQTFDHAHEEHLMQGGFHHFAKGEDTLALAAFEAAHDMDPANWTDMFWIKMVKLVQQQVLADQAAMTNAADKITR